jgi:hypothetical protein
LDQTLIKLFKTLELRVLSASAVAVEKDERTTAIKRLSITRFTTMMYERKKAVA